MDEYKLQFHIYKLVCILSFGLMSVGNVFAQLTPAPLLTDTVTADSAKNKRIRIINSDLLSYERTGGQSVQKLIGNVEIWHDSTLFYCDSAYHFEDANRLEAYDNVKVIMKDSVTLIGDRLIYDTETKIAEVYDNITLNDGGTILTTDKLIYDRVKNYGYYEDGGKLVDEDNVLTSGLGYYYPNEEKAYFKDSVVLVSPDYTLRTDTLGYDIQSKIANFLSLTEIDGKDGKIETSRGNYETQLKRVNLFSRSTVLDSTYSMEADTIFYDDQENMGYAQGKVIVQQEDSSLEIRGEYGEFNRLTDENMVTKNPVAIQIFEEDTLYLFADTLLSIIEKKAPPTITDESTPSPLDSLRQDSLSQIPDSTSAILVDSLNVPKIEIDSSTLPTIDSTPTPKRDSVAVNDTFPLQEAPPLLVMQDSSMREKAITDTSKSRVFKAFQHVRFFMNDMQGVADSMVYLFDDSIIYLYGNPVLWSDVNQLTGDTIVIWMKNGKADSMWIGPNAFLASQEDTVGFNQLKGKEMRAQFKDNELVRMHVIGNSESIYFAKNEEDSTQVTYEGMNQALSQEMILYFGENEIKKILFLAQPEGTFYPFFEIVLKENKLDGMKWRIEEKPEKPAILQAPIAAPPPGLDPTLPVDTSSSPPSEENR